MMRSGIGWGEHSRRRSPLGLAWPDRIRQAVRPYAPKVNRSSTCQRRSFWTCPGAHAVFVGLNFANVNTALRATVLTVPFKVIVRACCVEPYDGVAWAMPLRRLLVLKGLHPLTECCADSQHNRHPWEQPVSDTTRHHFLPSTMSRNWLNSASVVGDVDLPEFW